MSDNERTEITKVMMVIREFLSETRDVVNDAQKSQQWIIQFRNTLCYQDLEGNPNKFALKLLAEAKVFSDLKRRNQQMRWVRESLAKDGISNPSKKQLEERWMLIYGSEENSQDAPHGNAGVNGKSSTSCDQFTADGDVREDSNDGKSGTSANLYDQETASGNYQAPDKVSTDEKGGCGPLEKPNSQKSPQPSLFPVAQPEKRRYGKYRHVLLTDDEGRKLRESLGEDLEDAVAILDEYIQSLPVKAKGAKKNGAKWWMQEYEAKDHYIVLHHGWARKRLNEMRTEELNARVAELRCSAAETNAKAAEKRLENANTSSQPRQMYLTSDDISRRNAENGWRQLQLMHQMEGNG